MFYEAFKGVIQIIQISSEKNCAESFAITSVMNSSIVDSSLSKSVKLSHTRIFILHYFHLCR